MNNTPEKSLRNREYIRLLALLITCVILAFPNLFQFPELRLDPSWRYGVNDAAAHGLLFGKELIFTFGPYATLFSTQYHPDLFFLSLGGYLLISCALFAALFRLSKDISPWRSLALLAFAVPIATNRDALFFAIASLPILLAMQFRAQKPTPTFSSAADYVTIAICSAAVGLLPLIKGTFAIASLIAIGSAVFIFGLQRAAIAATALVSCVATMAVAWVISGQPLLGLFDYFHSLGPIISGYTDAMSFKGPSREINTYILCSALLLYFCWRHWATKPFKGWQLIGVGSIGLILYLGFKAAFVRHDTHALIGSSLLLWIAVLVSTQLTGRYAIVLVLSAFFGFSGIAMRYQDMRATISPEIMAIHYIEGAHSLWLQIAGKSTLDQRFEEANDSIRKSAPLTKPEGRADIYAYDQSALLANGIAWNPRPILQSYSVYTPELAELNAQHLRTPAAPEQIYFALQTIDNRYPTLDDSLSWLELFSRYEISTAESRYLVMRKLPTNMIKRVETGAPLIDANVGDSQPISLPEPTSGILWATIDIEPTALGKLTRTLYKLPHLYLAVKLRSGDEFRFRLIGAMAKTGFVLSPLVQTTEEFGALHSNPSQPYFDVRQIASVQIQGMRKSKGLWQNSAHFVIRPLAFAAHAAHNAGSPSESVHD